MQPQSTITSIITFLFLSIFTSLAQHKVTLTNGDTLSGKLSDSDTEGVLFLSYQDSPMPIKILEASIQRIQLSNKGILSDGIHKERIRLSNGDKFPITLTSLDKDSVSFTTNYLGNHTISRSMVSGIYFNNVAENLLYSGPTKLSEWKQFGGKWSLKDNVLTCIQRSKISKKIDNLTDNFKIEFLARWTEAAPKMRVYFSTSSADITKKQDSYYIEINASGQRIVKKENNRLVFLGTNLAQPDTYKNKFAKFKIFVDRKSKVYTLYIDGVKIKEFKDNKAVPKGSYIILECLQKHNETISFEDISVSGWNGGAPTGNKDLTEALKTKDLIMNTSSIQMAGKIDKIVRSGDILNVHLTIPFAKKTSIIPTSKIQYLNLQSTANTNPPKTDFKATLSLGGNLSFDKSTISDDLVTVTHPIIGELIIKLSALHEIKRTAKDQE